VALTNAYCSLADVKTALRITDTIDDAMLEMSINSASRLIDQYCNRYFWLGATNTEQRYYSTNDPYWVWIDDLVEFTSLDTSSNMKNQYDINWTNSGDYPDYELTPKNNLSNGYYSPYTGIKATGHYLFPYFGDNSLIRVTGRWGWSSVPDPIKQATVIQASRLFKRLESPLGVAGVSDIGIMRVGRAIDGDVAQLIDPFRQMRVNA
jgi:hypothetical protein